MLNTTILTRREYLQPAPLADLPQRLPHALRELKLAWGDETTFKTVLKMVDGLNRQVGRLPFPRESVFECPDGHMHMSLLYAAEALQQLKTVQFYPQLAVMAKEEEIDRIRLAVVACALCYYAAEPMLAFRVEAHYPQQDLPFRKHTLTPILQFLNRHAQFPITLKENTDLDDVLFQTYTPLVFPTIIPMSVIHQISQSSDKHLLPFVMSFVARRLQDAKFFNPQVFECLQRAERKIHNRIFLDTNGGCTGLSLELATVLIDLFKTDWSIEKGGIDCQKQLTCRSHELYIRWPEGFDMIANRAQKLWPHCLRALNRHSILSWAVRAGMVRLKADEKPKMMNFEWTESEKDKRIQKESAEAIELLDPMNYMSRHSKWYRDLNKLRMEAGHEAFEQAKRNFKRTEKQAQKCDNSSQRLREHTENRQASENPYVTQFPKVVDYSKTELTEKIEEFAALLNETPFKKNEAPDHLSPIEQELFEIEEEERIALERSKQQQLQKTFSSENRYPFTDTGPPENNPPDKPLVKETVSDTQSEPATAPNPVIAEAKTEPPTNKDKPTLKQTTMQFLSKFRFFSQEEPAAPPPQVTVVRTSVTDNSAQTPEIKTRMVALIPLHITISAHRPAPIRTQAIPIAQSTGGDKPKARRGRPPRKKPDDMAAIPQMIEAVNDHTMHPIQPENDARINPPKEASA